MTLLQCLEFVLRAQSLIAPPFCSLTHYFDSSHCLVLQSRGPFGWQMGFFQTEEGPDCIKHPILISEGRTPGEALSALRQGLLQRIAYFGGDNRVF